MRDNGFISGASLGRSRRWDAQRLVNLYPEMDQGGVNIAALIGTPGLSSWVTLPKSPYRGSLVSADGTLLYVVAGNTFYEINKLGTITSRGTLSSSQGRVSLAQGALQIMISDGQGKGYSYVVSTTTLSAIVAADAITSDFCAYMDTYFIANKHGTFSYVVSASEDCSSWNASKITSSSANPDYILAVKTMAQKVYTFGSVSIECYYDSGNSAFPFDRISGGLVEFGAVAPWSIEQVENEFYFIGQNSDGPGVFAFDGVNCDRVAPPWLSYQITQYGDVSDATAFTYTNGAHRFYVMNFPSVLVTWVYDVSTKMWHQRQTYGKGRWTVEDHAYFNNKHIVFDYASTAVYEMSPDYFTDAGTQIQRIRAGKTIIGEDFERIAHDKFDVWFEPGIDNAACTSPQAMMRYSDDGGYTWSNERLAAMQLRGDYKGRCRWMRNGQSRQRVYEVTVSDPVKVVMVAAVINARD